MPALDKRLDDQGSSPAGTPYVDRNIYLREVAKSKGCQGVDSWPQQPVRYT